MIYLTLRKVWAYFFFFSFNKNKLKKKKTKNKPTSEPRTNDTQKLD